MGKLYFVKNFLRGKVLRQNFLRKLIRQNFCTKNFYRRKSSWAKTFHRGKLLPGENFHCETFIQKNFHRNFQSPTKTIRDRRKGNRPGKDVVRMVFILDNDDFEDTRDTPPDSIVQRKSPQSLRTLLRSRKTFQAKLIFRKTFWSKLIFQKTSSARRQSPC